MRNRDVTPPAHVKEAGIRVAVSHDKVTGEAGICLTPTVNMVDQVSVIMDPVMASEFAATVMDAVRTVLRENKKLTR
jgi:hypothetical protein